MSQRVLKVERTPWRIVIAADQSGEDWLGVRIGDDASYIEWFPTRCGEWAGLAWFLFTCWLRGLVRYQRPSQAEDARRAGS